MKLVSVVCHPLLMATYFSLALLITVPELFPYQPKAMLYLVLVIFLTTCVIPAFSIYSLKLFSFISSLELTDRKERPLPFLLIFIWYGIAAYLFVFKLEIGEPLSIVIVAVTLLIGVLFLITRWFKISIHSTAIWGAAGVLAFLVIVEGLPIKNLFLVTILLAGLVSTSRLYLGYHRPKEIWTGSFLGFLFSFFVLYLFY